MIIAPFQANSNDQALQTIIRQLNQMKDLVNAYASGNDTLVGTLTTDINGITTDSIMKHCTIAVVNGDYDLTYTNQGEITVDG